MRNPFAKPESVSRHLKIAVSGKSGKGKTVFGLDAKNHGLGPVKVVSNEAGDVHYIDHPQWGGFQRLATSSIAELKEAIEYLEANPEGTLVVDTVTGVYEALISAMAKSDGSVNQKAWGLIKRTWRGLMARLNNLPMNIVEVVHENDISETDEKTGKTVVVGQKLDAEKTFERNPDVLIRLGTADGKRVAMVLKDRTGTFQAGQVIEDPHIGMWAKSVRKGAVEARVATPEDVDAANEATMTGKAAPPVATTTQAPADSDGGTLAADQVAPYEALLLACMDGFNAQKHKENWLEKHKNEIKILPKFARDELRAAYEKAPVNPKSEAA